MFRNERKSALRKNILLSYLLLVLLPLVLIVAFMVQDITEAFQRDNQLLYRQMFANSMANIDGFFSSYIELSRSLYADEFLTNYLKKSYPEGTSYEKKHFDYREIVQTYQTRLTYEGIDGDIVSIKTDNRQLLLYTGMLSYLTEKDAQSDWYQALMDPDVKYAVSPTFNHGGTAYIPFTMRLTSKNTATSILKIDIPSDNLSSRLSDENRLFYVILADGSILASNEKTRIGQSLRGTEYEPFLDQLSSEHQFHHLDHQVVCVGQVASSAPITPFYLVEIVTVAPMLSTIFEALSSSIPLLILLLAFDIFMIWMFTHKFSFRILHLVDQVEQVSAGDMNITFEISGNDEITGLTLHMQSMLDRINKLIKSVFQAQIATKEAEIRALQSQMNPHLLFNCLQTINASALKHGAVETSDMIVSYSRIVRETIDWSQSVVPLEYELELVDNYLYIQHMRFGDRLLSHTSIDPECIGAQLPKLAMQTLVENAVIHGVEKSSRPCELNISVVRQGEEMRITIQDTGAGIEPERLNHLHEMLANLEDSKPDRHVGLINLQRRIHLLYGRPYGISIHSEPNQGTTITIILPLLACDPVSTPES